VSPVRNELGFYIPEDDIHHSHSLDNFRSCIAFLFVCYCRQTYFVLAGAFLGQFYFEISDGQFHGVPC
jgi:hypothetical protein